MAVPQRDKRGRFASAKSSGNGRSLADNQMRRLAAMVANATMSRSSLVRSLLDPRRSVDDECGYPETTTISREDYRALYDREPIAARVVQLMPRDCWLVEPEIFETESPEEETAFEAAWQEMGRALRGESWHAMMKGSPIWEWLYRADELSGIGHYGALLLGFDDGKELHEPVEPTEKGRNLLYLRAFDESLATILSYDDDLASPRYGMPTAYSLTLHDPNQQGSTESGTPRVTRRTHWTRVVHLADNLSSSEVFGVPRMRPVFNRLYDLRKIYGSDAEAYWLNVVMKLFFETHPQLGGDVEVDDNALRRMMEKMMSGLQRWGRLSGMSAKSIAPRIVDPTPHIDAQITAICVQLAVPKRIFMGSEQGQLASEQDVRTWWTRRVPGRQQRYCIPRIIVPFVDRLIWAGVLPKPQDGYRVHWPSLFSLNDEQRAEVAAKRTEAMGRYVTQGVEALMAPLHFLSRELGYSDDEAEAILEATIGGLQEEGEANAEE